MNRKVNIISIIGSGWVGEIIGEGFTKLGNNVIYFDVVEKELPNFTNDMNYAIEHSDISFICVPTPATSAGIELSYIKEAMENIGRALVDKNRYHLVVVKSTVVPTTTEKIIIPLLEEYSLKQAGEIGVCTNPEFLTQIPSDWSRGFFNTDRIVIGEYDKKSGDVLEALYRPLKKPIFRTDLRTAEMVKYASNCMLATRISYWSEIFLICKELGIDAQEVANIAATDSRIGKYGTITGKAFGGVCLPKDLEAFIAFAEKHREMKLLKVVDEINKEMKKKYGFRE